MRLFLLACIRVYRLFLSPLLPAACRFLPTCSSYAADAIDTHGALKGGWLAARRLCRCHPWAEGGLDPVPARRAAPSCHPSPSPSRSPQVTRL